MEDEKLIDLFWNRSNQAIRETSDKYGTYLNDISMNILRGEGDAAECVNDTYLAVWNSIPPQRPEAFKSWIGRIARSISFDCYRREHAGKRGGHEMDMLLLELSDCIPCPVRGQEESSNGEVAKILNLFLKDMKKENRMIFLRRYWYGNSVEEIAERFSMKESRVRSSLFRSREALRICLEREGIRL